MLTIFNSMTMPQFQMASIIASALGHFWATSSVTQNIMNGTKKPNSFIDFDKLKSALLDNASEWDKHISRYLFPELNDEGNIVSTSSRNRYSWAVNKQGHAIVGVYSFQHGQVVTIQIFAHFVANIEISDKAEARHLNAAIELIDKLKNLNKTLIFNNEQELINKANLLSLQEQELLSTCSIPSTDEDEE